jgi:hypothetical protein
VRAAVRRWTAGIRCEAVVGLSQARDSNGSVARGQSVWERPFGLSWTTVDFDDRFVETWLHPRSASSCQSTELQ